MLQVVIAFAEVSSNLNATDDATTFLCRSDSQIFFIKTTFFVHLVTVCNQMKPGSQIYNYILIFNKASDNFYTVKFT